MPITPTGLARFAKPLTFTYCGETVNVSYRPAAFGSGAMEKWNAIADRVNAAQTEEESAAAALEVAELFCSIIAAWDYCEDPSPESPDVPGPAVPLTPSRLLEEMGKYPLFFPSFLEAIVRAIAEDVTRGKVSGTAPYSRSDDTSSQTAQSTSLPTAPSRKRSKSSSSRAGSGVAARRSNG